jgi:hypothetical protein
MQLRFRVCLNMIAIVVHVASLRIIEWHHLLPGHNSACVLLFNKKNKPAESWTAVTPTLALCSNGLSAAGNEVTRSQNVGWGAEGWDDICSLFYSRVILHMKRLDRLLCCALPGERSVNRQDFASYLKTM